MRLPGRLRFERARLQPRRKYCEINTGFSRRGPPRSAMRLFPQPAREAKTSSCRASGRCDSKRSRGNQVQRSKAGCHSCGNREGCGQLRGVEYVFPNVRIPKDLFWNHHRVAGVHNRIQQTASP